MTREQLRQHVAAGIDEGTLRRDDPLYRRWLRLARRDAERAEKDKRKRASVHG